MSTTFFVTLADRSSVVHPLHLLGHHHEGDPGAMRRLKTCALPAGLIERTVQK